ncbi:hypothetical protein [Streptomyces decoyicus]
MPYGVVSVVCGPATRTLVYDSTLISTLITDVLGTAMDGGIGPGGVTFRNHIFVGAQSPRRAP